MLGDISGPDLQLSIDLSRLRDKDNVPLEFIDRDGRPYQPSQAAGGPQPGSVQTQSSLEVAFHQGQSATPLGCEVRSDGLHYSMAYARMLPRVLDWWMFGAVVIGAICVIAAVVELMTISTLLVDPAPL
jgi:hypothetical protein